MEDNFRSMQYIETLEATKVGYPFTKWREMFFPDEADDIEGMEQYTQENCDAAKKIMDQLISNLSSIGETAPEKDKMLLFKTAVESLNDLNEDNGDCLIETCEREDLCELFDQISIAAGLDPKNYGDGEGLASECRNW